MILVQAKELNNEEMLQRAGAENAAGGDSQI
jgi:hypothetical protein